MANQIIVTDSGNVQVSITPTNNVQVEISRAAITTLTTVGNANYANVAGTVANSSQPNITSLGTLVNLTSAGNITAPYFIGNVVGNISGNIVVPGTNTSVLFNQQGSAGASDAFQFNYATNVATIIGNLSATNISGNGAGLFAITGANVSGQVGYAGVANSVSGGNVSGAVSYATTANSVAGANVSGQVAYAAVANSVSVGNVSGIGNIATVNLTGSTSNVLYGNGVFAPVVATNANYANFAGTAFSVSGSNVSGAVANATYANNAGNATIANSANSVAVANVSGIGNIATVNLDGNSSNILYGNGVFASTPIISNVANANYANFAGQVVDATQSNITTVGTLTNVITSGQLTSTGAGNASDGGGQLYLNGSGNNRIDYNTNGTGAPAITTRSAGTKITLYPALSASQTDYAIGIDAATMWSSIPVSDPSFKFKWYGNTTEVANLDGTGNFNVAGNITAANINGNVANANYANFAGTAYNVSGSNVSGQVANALVAGTVYTNAQPNITSVGTLTTLAVSGNLSSGNANLGNLAIANFFSGDGGLLSNIAAGNIVGNLPVRFAVKNTSGGTLVKGTPVYCTGTVGATTTLEVAASRADTSSTMACIGLLEQDLTNNAFGFALSIGTLSNFNTSTYTVGTELYVGATGGITNTRPTNSNLIQPIGTVGRVNVSTGEVIVNIWDVYSLPNLENGNIWVGNTGNGYPTQVVLSTANVGNANFASYAGNVTVAAQSNITSLGNLVSLTVRDSNTSNPITQFIPTGNTIGTATFGNTMLRIDNYTDLGNANSVQNISFVKSRGNATTPAATANNDVAMRVASYVYNGNTYPKVGQFQFIAPQAANANLQLANTAWTAGQFQVQVGNPYGNVANANSSTNINQLTYNQNGTLVLLSGTNSGGVVAPAMNMITYGIAANGVGAGGQIFSQRARGNRDSNVAVANGDQIGALAWQAYNGNAFFTTRFAQITANVNTAHGAIANGASIPTDINLITCNNTASFTTAFYGNGTVTFPGDITSTGTATITTSNIANTQLNRFQETVYAIGSTSGTITPDFVNGSIQTMTLTGSITMNTLANVIAGRSMTLIVTQGGSGSYTLTSSMLFAGGIKTLSTSVGAKDIISVFYDGSSYYASLTKGYV